MTPEKRQEKIKLAHEISKLAHTGQFYAFKQPYFESHIEPVVEELLRMTPESLYSQQDLYILTCIAYLHDTIEDTDITYIGIKAEFGTVIADAVLAMTRGSSETYKEYINRLQHDSYATIVKRADAMVNLRTCIITNSGTRAQRYLDVLQVLSA